MGEGGGRVGVAGGPIERNSGWDWEAIVLMGMN